MREEGFLVKAYHGTCLRLKCGAANVKFGSHEQGIQPGADYMVVLHAADLYWSYPGQRIFSVSANGVPALTNYDVIAEAGARLILAHTASSASLNCEPT